MSVEQHHSLAWSATARAAGTTDTLYPCCAVLLVSAVSFVHLVASLSADALVVGACLFAGAYFRDRTWPRHFKHVGFHIFLTLLFGAFSRSSSFKRLTSTIFRLPPIDGIVSSGRSYDHSP